MKSCKTFFSSRILELKYIGLLVVFIEQFLMDTAYVKVLKLLKCDWL